MTKHFKLQEFLSDEDADRLRVNRELEEEIFSNLEMLSKTMEIIRILCGNHPIRINSAYRNELHNIAVGGSSTSAHLSGLACDFHFMNKVSIQEGAMIIRNSGIHYDQLIEYDNFLHIGLFRNKRREYINMSTRKKAEGNKYDYR